jgi:hypothetical protein
VAGDKECWRLSPWNTHMNSHLIASRLEALHVAGITYDDIGRKRYRVGPGFSYWPSTDRWRSYGDRVAAMVSSTSSQLCGRAMCGADRSVLLELLTPRLCRTEMGSICR